MSDKYADVRVTMSEIFNDNYHYYVYRRIHSILRQNNRVISEKVVHRLMAEEKLPARKVYLSPVLDCFNGKVVSWSIGTHPNAQLVNTMLDEAINTLTGDNRSIIHSDRGGHYR